MERAALEPDAPGATPRRQSTRRGSRAGGRAAYDAYPDQPEADHGMLAPVGGTRIPADMPRAKDTKRKKGRAALIIAIFVVLLAVPAFLFGPNLLKRLPFPLLGAPAAAPASHSALPQGTPFATYTPGPTPTVYPNYQQYVSQQSAYIVDYPQAWTTQAVERTSGGQYDHVEVFAPHDSASSFVVEQAGAIAVDSNAEILTSEVNAIKSQGASVGELPGTAKTQSIGGELWQRDEYTVNEKGVTLHLAILACHHEGKAYAIVLGASSQTFAHDDSTFFEPMLKSFRFAG